jgi:hypothetical protein
VAGAGGGVVYFLFGLDFSAWREFFFLAQANIERAGGGQNANAERIPILILMLACDEMSERGERQGQSER